MGCILMSSRGWVRQTRYVCLRIILTVSDHLTLHTNSCMVWMELAWWICRWLDSLTHLKERIHLLLGAHLVS